eukprot:CAMPEP_0198142942 /NCGR_PEP_ID=MMETSP1443-20131203/5603_1 /TAXON_ID=186043 /ORGANISM="Entomoneis sp., Strain CCMP2396" /LENGTH=107 /DNA_ID=CAMNT_0043806071 /DNA_START=121 /DNA_END=440 /DNA_ORIENTATION=-
MRINGLHPAARLAKRREEYWSTNKKDTDDGADDNMDGDGDSSKIVTTTGLPTASTRSKGRCNERNKKSWTNDCRNWKKKNSLPNIVVDRIADTKNSNETFCESLMFL